MNDLILYPQLRNACGDHPKKTSIVVYFMTSYTNALPIIAPLARFFSSKPKVKQASLLTFFEACIKKGPRKLLFHFLISIVFLPVASKSA